MVIIIIISVILLVISSSTWDTWRRKERFLEGGERDSFGGKEILFTGRERKRTGEMKVTVYMVFTVELMLQIW